MDHVQSSAEIVPLIVYSRKLTIVHEVSDRTFIMDGILHSIIPCFYPEIVRSLLLRMEYTDNTMYYACHGHSDRTYG